MVLSEREFQRLCSKLFGPRGFAIYNTDKANKNLEGKSDKQMRSIAAKWVASGLKRELKPVFVSINHRGDSCRKHTVWLMKVGPLLYYGDANGAGDTKQVGVIARLCVQLVDGVRRAVPYDKTDRNRTNDCTLIAAIQASRLHRAISAKTIAPAHLKAYQDFLKSTASATAPR